MKEEQLWQLPCNRRKENENEIIAIERSSGHGVESNCHCARHYGIIIAEWKGVEILL